MKRRTGVLLTTAFLAGVAANAVPVRRVGGGFSTAPAHARAAPQDRRLLALFRDAFRRVRADYVDTVDARTLIENALNGMLSGLDPHSGYMNPRQWRDMDMEARGEFTGIGIEIAPAHGAIEVVSVVDHAPAARAGIEAGDVITAIDRKSLAGAPPEDVLDRLAGALNRRIMLTIRRKGTGRTTDVALTREVIHIPAANGRIFGGIGYVRLTDFSERSERSLRDVIGSLRRQRGNRLDGIILDLRDNPGGLLDEGLAVADDFLRHGAIVTIHSRHPAGSGRWNAAPKRHDIAGDVPMAVLINAGSASASEIVAGALQDHRRAVVVGTPSFGKGTGQTAIPLPGNGGGVLLTTDRFYTPSGRAIQGVGVTPDVVVQAPDAPGAPSEPEHEPDLPHALPGAGGTATAQKPLPWEGFRAIANKIPSRPPPGWPEYDPRDPGTDFQLQQALTILRALAARRMGDAH